VEKKKERGGDIADIVAVSPPSDMEYKQTDM
jgi:hypothetical protein